MPDLESRFRSLARTAAPDLWPDAQRREPLPSPGRPAARRLLIAVTALAIAIAGFAVSVRAFTAGTSAPGPANSPPAPTGRSANGAIYYRVGGGDGPSRIEAVEADGTGQRVVFDGDPLLHVAQIAWSPDGSRIAYLDAIPAERGIYVADPDGSDPVKLTDGANDAWPSWSPDGSKIVFSSSADDPTLPTCEPGADFRCPTDVYVVDADGTDLTRLTDDAAPEYQPAWSPNGDRIAFVRSSGGTAGEAPLIFTMDVDGSDVRQASSGEGGSDFSPSWSPDGSRIAFVGFRFENTGIWVVDANGSNEHQIVGKDWYSVQDPVWSPAGDLIAFAGSPNGGDAALYDALYVMDPEGAEVRQLAEAPGWGVAGDIAWQPIRGESVTPEPTPSETAAAPTATVTDVIDLAGPGSAVAYGEGSVWVAVSNDDGSFAGELLRLDPGDGTAQAVIPVPAVPEWEVGGGGLAVGDGSVWIAGSVDAPGGFDAPGGGSNALLVRVDASSNTVTDAIDLGGLNGADVAVDANGVWVWIFADDGKMEVDRVDPATGAVLARIPIDASYGHLIFARGGNVVAVGNEVGADTVGRTALFAIDPQTDQVVGSLPLGRSTWPMAWPAMGEDGFLRVVTGDRLLTIDPGTLDVLADVPLRSTGDALAAGDGGVWFLDPQNRASVQRFDQETGQVDLSIELPIEASAPVALVLSPDAVWALDVDRKLVRIGLR